jgi:abequosyltransferase
MQHHLLSICIPTYNFGKFIGQTLDSILPNLVDGVELVILDGGSTDDTGQVVVQRQKDFPGIRYHRQEFKGGIDKDIAKVVSLSHGKYCWLFSADDTMMPGAVKKVLDFIQTSDCDIYLCEQMLCTYEMKPIKAHPIFKGVDIPQIFDLGNTQQRKRYFQNARTSEAFFSFLSSPIFKRDAWEKANGIPETFYETCWGLAGRLLSLVPGGLVVFYMKETLIYKRGDNDSFREHGMVNRLRISVEGFSHIAEKIFGENSSETRHVRRVIRNEWTLQHILSIKLLTEKYPDRENATILRKVVAKHYLNAGVLNGFKYLIFLLTPMQVITLLKDLKRIGRQRDN